MTRLTAVLIQNDPEVYASAFGPIDGKYGLYVGTLDETPSGSKRPRHLLTSEPVYATAEEAKAAAEQVILKTQCQHERLNEDGICRGCGQDRRGI